jgi:predicted permease
LEPGNDAQIFVPVMMKGEMTPMSAFDDLTNRRSRWINVFGRLKPGISREQAKASLQPYYHSILEMEVTQKDFNDASPYMRQQFLRSTMDLLPGSQGRPSLRRQFEKPLWVLMALVGVVLLIACANIANLLLARAASRQKEIAVRMALGAGRLRIMRQLMVESVLLAVIGGVAGLLLAAWANGVLLGLLPQGSSPLPISAAPDLRILVFNFVVALVTGLLFGLAPALQTTRPDLAPTLKDQAGAVLGGGGQANLRKALVVAQVTLSLLLLFGAGLFVRSLKNLRDLSPGFSTSNLVAFAVDPSLNKYPLPRIKSFYQQLTDNLNSVPGVKAAGFGMIGLMEGNEWDSTVTVEGYEAKPGEDMNPFFNGVSPGYFSAMGISLVAGRDFTVNDTEMVQSKIFPFPLPTKVMVNRKFAQFFFKDRPAVGRHIGFGGDPNTPANMEIIGVVADAKYTGMRDDIPRQVFIPYLASPLLAEMTGYVRTQSAPEQAYAAIRAEVRKLDPNMPIYNLRTLESKIDESLLNERLIATLSSVFGFLATALALIGLYGVMAYTVARRTREIGIRIALGASTKTVVWMVMREVLLLVGVGIAVGLPAAWGLARLVESQLYGIPAHDPVTMIAATSALAMVACLSGYLPARRASRVHPTTALRYE